MGRGSLLVRPLASDTINYLSHQTMPGTDNTQRLDALLWLRRMRAIEFLQLANDVGAKFAGIAVVKDLYSNGDMPPHVSQMIDDETNEATIIVRRTLIELFTKSTALGGLGLSPQPAQLVAEPILSKVLSTLQDNDAILRDRKEDIRLTSRNGKHFDLSVLKGIVDQAKTSFIALKTRLMQPDSPDSEATQSTCVPR